jgi:hypothetical protein
MKIKITYPESWADITLQQYLDYYKHVKPYEGTEEYAVKNLQSSALYFCKIPGEFLYKLPESTFDKVAKCLDNLFTSVEKHPLVPEFTIGNTTYGFIPELNNMSYGEYLDLVSSTQKDLWSYMAITMSILYRPIKQRMGTLSGTMYTIESYNGTNDDQIELFKHAITMDIVLGSIGFFLDLQKDLQTGILTYMVETLKKDQRPEMQAALETLQQNGVDISQLPHLLTMILPSSTR